MKNTFSLAPLLAFALYVPAAAASDCTTDRVAVHDRLVKLVDAFQTNDVKTIAALTHPSLIQLVGGQHKFLQMTQQGLDDLAARGARMDGSKFGAPTKTYSSGSKAVCFIPIEMALVLKGAKLIANGFIVAVNDGTGAGWTFMDGAGFANDPALIGRLLPGLPADLPLPPTSTERIQ